MAEQKRAPLKAAAASMRMVNPIRNTMDTIKMPQHHEKERIPLSIGDPTVFDNLKVHQFVNEQLHKAVDSYKWNGYVQSSGTAAARKAVADKFTTKASPLNENDVLLTSGCSGALDLCITAVANAGDNILIPKPGFSLYKTLCDNKGIECRYYNLLPEKNWEIDLEHLSSLIDSNTRAVLVNNPSNPCGSVWSEQHMLEILEEVEKHSLVLISDEVYFDMVFEPNRFISFGWISKNVPVLVTGGVAKRFLVPGWRLGWIIVHDRHELLSEIRVGMYKLTQLILGPTTLIQAILPDILHNTPQEFFEETDRQLQEHAQLLMERIPDIEGLSIIKPGGAMYAMIQIHMDKFKDIKDDVDFTQKLLTEENVFVLPGSIFGAPNFVRVVICPAKEKLEEACDRIAAFCLRHSQLTN
ncbi:Tyrosine aminotransferase [Balamuthia mandrillaris]